MNENRVVRLPLMIPNQAVWRDLRRLAFQCAAFGNHLLTQSYAQAKGLKAELTPYTDFNMVLSAGIRDAVARECVGLWRRLGKKILRGEQTLARFSANRALVVRDRGVELARVEDGAIVAHLRLHPKSEGERTTLPLYMPAFKRDPYLAELVPRLINGNYSITKATLMFERPGRKIHLLLSYRKPILAAESSSDKKAVVATLGPLGEDGYSLAVEGNGRRLSLTGRVFRLVQMKRDFAGIHYRLRRTMSRGQKPGWQRRRAFLKAGSFEAWARGPLHEMSHAIAVWCERNGMTELNWKVEESDNETALPWYGLRQQLAYKLAEKGCAFSQQEAVSEQKRELRKKEDAGSLKKQAKTRTNSAVAEGELTGR